MEKTLPHQLRALSEEVALKIAEYELAARDQEKVIESLKAQRDLAIKQERAVRELLAHSDTAPRQIRPIDFSRYRNTTPLKDLPRYYAADQALDREAAAAAEDERA